jgi:hypothetical protein
MRYATPFITGLFMVSLVSGIALFFHVGQNYFREMHEILSLVLIAPFVLHLLRNWRPFLTYFKRVPMTIALAISLVAAGFFAWEGANATGGGNPAMALVRQVQNSTLANVAPLYGHTGDTLIAALTEKGYKIASADTTIDAIATASGKDSMGMLADLASVKK